MLYLKEFTLLDEDEEQEMVYLAEQRRIHNNTYPLDIYPSKSLYKIKFSPITIFCGGNGSGKTTLINIIAEKLNARRKSSFDKGTYFDLYVRNCKFEMTFEEPYDISLITSDDVFDYLLDVRSINSNVSRKKEFLSREYSNYKFHQDNSSFDNYDELRATYDAKTKSMSKFVRERLGNNTITEWSNGESAIMFWEKEIKENAIYILDEPENSLSAENQLKLKKYIEEAVRFYNCQFIISTHSPFLLKLQDAKIYDLNSNPVTTKKWTELSNVLVYYNFFKEFENEFTKNQN